MKLIRISRIVICPVLFSLVLFLACEKQKTDPLFPADDFISEGSWEGPYWPTEGWRYCRPEEVGMDSEKLRELNDEILLLLELHVDVNTVMIIKDGYVVAEQYYSREYTADSLHSIYSCTKSLISALVGIAMEQGYIADEQELMCDFFEDYEMANLDEAKRSITLWHLLTMSAGFEWYELEYPYGDERNTFYNFVRSSNRVQFVLDRPMTADPGTEYAYNSGNSHLLSAIVQESTGMRADSFALEHVFTPLGISRYSWPLDAQGVALGGHGARMLPRDMAKFGYLYLKDGQWDGEQLVPAWWVDASQQKHMERKYIPDDYYGYHWWVSGKGYYSAVGFGGQWIMVVPEHELVVVFTNHFTEGDQLQWSTPERLLQTYILPAFN
jgi:CubicO group peptidase (beta-lactamase class C family)